MSLHLKQITFRVKVIDDHVIEFTYTLTFHVKWDGEISKVHTFNKELKIEKVNLFMCPSQMWGLDT